MVVNTGANNNTAIGHNALAINNGSGNTAVGRNALQANTSGTTNTALGVNALSNVSLGSNNIGLGNNAQVPNLTGSNQVRVGNTNITYAGIQVSWTVTSDRIWKKEIRTLPYGLNMLNKLRPVDYIRKNDNSNTREMGFIAQELEEVITTLGYEDQGFLTKDDEGRLSVRYNDFIALLTKSVQEQQEQIKSQEQEIAELKEKLSQYDSLNKRLHNLENRLNAQAMVDKN